jgi:hypothetical protein
MPRSWTVPLLLVVALAWTGACPAAIALDPAKACGLLTDAYLGGLKYHAMDQARYRCVSPRRTLPYGGDVQNEMQFQAWGDAKQVTRLELHFDIPGNQELQPTLEKMAKLGETLSQRALSRPLPEAIRKAILARAPAQAQVGDARLSVLRSTSAYMGGGLILRIE